MFWLKLFMWLSTKTYMCLACFKGNLFQCLKCIGNLMSSQVFFANLWHLRKLSLLPIKQADDMLGLHNEIIHASVDWFFKKAHKNHLGMMIMQDYARTFKHQTIFMLIQGWTLALARSPRRVSKVSGECKSQITRPFGECDFSLPRNWLNCKINDVFYILFRREISKHNFTIVHICMAKFYTPNCPKNGRWSATLSFAK
mgnify:CR=1 FL=1